MSIYRNSFCIVCIANFCRSPVVENLLKKRFKTKYEFISAGLSPISLPGMDSRSIKFLENNNVEYAFHNPKKINTKMLRYFNYFIAVDLFVLNELNKIYPKYKNKFILLTSQFNDISIFDPYKFDNDQYENVMKNIKLVAENIDLEQL